MNNNFLGSQPGRYSLRILLPLLMLITLLAPPKAGAEVYTGALGGADNVWEQWIPVTIPSDGTFTTQMTVSGDLTGGNSGHCLYDSTKTNSYPYACAYTSPLGPWGLKAGSYYLKAWTNSSGRGTYTVTTTFTSQPLANDAEPNDAYAQAGTLSTSGSVTGHLGYWNIVGSQDYKIDYEDWWRLTLPSSGKLNLSYTYDQALAGATGIYLYAQDGSTIISDTNSTLAAGTYYLQAWNNNGNKFGGYTISLAFSGTAPCTFTATPATVSQSNGAGSGSITLTASATSCTWSASSNQSWLTLATASGTGSGTLSYSVSANTSTSARTATITVGGQTVTVTQAGAAAATVPPSGTVTASGPITAHTLTLQNVQIASSDLSGGVTLYIAAYFGGQYYFFTPNGWTTQTQPYQSGITTAPNAVTLASGDLSGLVGTTVLLGYGNGSGTSALNDMLQKQKYAQIHTIAATTGAGTTNLQDLSLWNIYGSGQMLGAAMEFGDEIGGDFGDEDRDGNPANVWSTGTASDSSGFGYDNDWAVSKGTWSAPFTVLWNGCLSYGGPPYSIFALGRKNAGFTNRANSPDPMTPEIYMQHESGSGGKATLVVGTAAGASVSAANITTTKVAPGPSVSSRTPYDYDAICGDFKLEWNNQTVTSYFNGSKIGDMPYASGYGEPFAIAFRAFANPIKVNSITVTQP